MDDWLHQFKSGTFALPEHFRELANGAYVKHLLAPVRLTAPDAFGRGCCARWSIPMEY